MSVTNLILPKFGSSEAHLWVCKILGTDEQKQMLETGNTIHVDHALYP